MKIIKYSTASNNICLVYKTKIFIYYLFIKNNAPYYYEKNGKNYNKTKKTVENFLKENIINITSKEYDDFELLLKTDTYEKNIDYYMISETFGNNNGTTFCVFEKDKKILIKNGQRFSPTFIFSVILYKFNFYFASNFHGYGQKFIKEIAIRDARKIKKFIFILFYKYLKNDFKDIKINFKYYLYSGDQKFLSNVFRYYDELIKINTDKIISSFELYTEEKKISYIYYAMSYFSSLFFIDFIKKNKIENKHIMMNSCLFNIDLCKTFFDNKNHYYFSDSNNLKNGVLFFTEEKYNKYINLKKDRYKNNMIKKMEKNENFKI